MKYLWQDKVNLIRSLHAKSPSMRKQSESFLIQPGQTIWVSRHTTLRTQYLCLGVFLWNQYKILLSYKGFCKLQFLFMYSSSKTFVTRWSVSVMIAFEQYIRDHLSGTKVRIWIGLEYDAVFNFSCIASCYLTKIFTFFCMSFLS